MFRFCEAQMCEIVQFWLDNKMVTAMGGCKVASVGWDGQAAMFGCRIEQKPPEKKEKSE